MAQTTGKISNKKYRCVHCETESSQSTNHYGEIYSGCTNGLCVSRRPVLNSTRKAPRHVCLEELPEGWVKPEPWKQVRWSWLWPGSST